LRHKKEKGRRRSTKIVLTRAEGKDTLTRVLKNVFKLEDDNPLLKALSKDELLVDIVDVIN
jgi:hypothetical protein